MSSMMSTSRKRRLDSDSELVIDSDDNLSSDSDSSIELLEYYESLPIGFLFYLVKTGQVDKLKKCKTSADLLVKNNSGDTLLHKSLEKIWLGKSGMFCDLEMITYLLTTAPKLARLKNKAGETALCYACKKVYIPEIKTMLELYPSKALNIRDKTGTTPLYYLLQSQSVIHNLKSSNSAVGENLDNMSTIACQELEVLNLIQLLINKGAHINIKNRRKITPLECLIKSEIINGSNFYHEACKLLIHNGAFTGVILIRYAKTFEVALDIMNTLDIDRIDKRNRSVLHSVLVNKKSSIREKLIKILIERKCKIVDEKSDIITLAIDRNCDFSTIQVILQNYEGYNINSRGSCGNTVLTKFCTDMDTYKMLTKLGADPTVVTPKGYSLLVTAIQLGDITMVKTLINLGMNPLQCGTKNTISMMCTKLFKEDCDQQYLYKWSILFKYVINLPQFKNNENDRILVKCYSQVLSRLCKMFNSNCKNRIRIPRILCILFNQTNIKNLIAGTKTIGDNFGMFSVSYESNYDVLTGMLITNPSILGGNGKNTNEFIHNIIDAGYCISNIPKSCITPLTMYLILVKTETIAQINLIYEFIHQGVNVESNVLFIKKNYDFGMYFQLKLFKGNEYIPDALLLTLMNDQENLLKLFINYWWGPPLSLICYIFQSATSRFLKTFDILASYGGVPHGTSAFSLLNNCLTQLSNTIERNRPLQERIQYRRIFDHLEKLKSNPLSLQELAKYAVRRSLAERASQPRSNLPDLIRQVVDPTLQFLVSQPNFRIKLN